MLQIQPIPAFEDNYIWLLHNEHYAVVVDPGDAAPVMSKLASLKLTLTDILITHHHQDHIGGVASLIDVLKPNVYAPRRHIYDFPHQAVDEDDSIALASLGLQLRVMWLPGHTTDHVAYYNDALLFCGDVLFGAGCGRLMGGTAEQHFTSLNRLKTLPLDTKVYCTHEYTAKNIAFARTVEPNNTDLHARELDVAALRQANLPTLPTTIGLELKTNPFLRCQQPEIAQHADVKTSDALSVFVKIRQLRNHY